MIKYSIQPKKNYLSEKREVKFYPQAAPSTPLMLEQIAERIEKRSSVSSSDVKAVLDALQTEVIYALRNGYSVRLGDLGSFRLTIRANGAESAEEAKRQGASLIKAANVQFTKSGTMRKAFAKCNLDFGLQADTTKTKK